MNQKKLEIQRERLKNFISMLDVFPNESETGRIYDSYWRGQLECELAVIERRLEIAYGEHFANQLLTITSGLKRLGYM